MINQSFDLAGAATVIIPLDRWSYPAYSVDVKTGTALVEVTLDRVNRGETPSWEEAVDQSGNALTALTDFAELAQSPYEAIRITATGSTTGRVMQTGAK